MDNRFFISFWRDLVLFPRPFSTENFAGAISLEKLRHFFTKLPLITTEKWRMMTVSFELLVPLILCYYTVKRDLLYSLGFQRSSVTECVAFCWLILIFFSFCYVLPRSFLIIRSVVQSYCIYDFVSLMSLFLGERWHDVRVTFFLPFSFYINLNFFHSHFELFLQGDGALHQRLRSNPSN